MISRNTLSPESQEEGGRACAKSLSDSSRKPAQLARRKFTKVRVKRGVGVEPRRVVRIGRWSELREVEVDQEREEER